MFLNKIKEILFKKKVFAEILLEVMELFDVDDYDYNFEEY